MPTEGGDSVSDAQALRSAMDEVLAQLDDEDRVDISDRVADRNLGIGLRLGLEHPREARRLLELIEAGIADRLPGEDGAMTVMAATGRDRSEEPGASPQIPVCSLLLAQAASVSASDLVNENPEARFGWAAKLTRDEVLSLGRVVDDMLAAGSPPDIAHGFGLAWDAGVTLPRKERNGLFALFGDLEITVGGILEGRDLRADQGTARSTGFGALFASWLSGPRLGNSQASAAIERGGDPAKRGLVALWNAWAAMRFQSLIRRPTFELLIEPWVTVVGPLPEP